MSVCSSSPGPTGERLLWSLGQLVWARPHPSYVGGEGAQLQGLARGAMGPSGLLGPLGGGHGLREAPEGWQSR